MYKPSARFHECNDMYHAKKIIKDYQSRVQFWADDTVDVTSYVKNLLQFT